MNEMTLGKVGESGALDRPLVRHLAIIVLLKLIFLFLLWFMFFRIPGGATDSEIDFQNHIAGDSNAAVSTQKEANQ